MDHTALKSLTFAGQLPTREDVTGHSLGVGRPPARAESDRSLPRLGEQRGGPPAVLAVIREAKEVKCHAHTDHE